MRPQVVEGSIRRSRWPQGHPNDRMQIAYTKRDHISLGCLTRQVGLNKVHTAPDAYVCHFGSSLADRLRPRRKANLNI